MNLNIRTFIRQQSLYVSLSDMFRPKLCYLHTPKL